MWIKLYKEWWKARKVFVMPKLHCKIGSWYNDPCLPMWRDNKCHFFNRDVVWKTKWTPDDIRFEFPPHFTIVLFGYSFSLWVQYHPIEDSTFYWEALLLHNYHYSDIEELIKKCGCYSSSLPNGKWQHHMAVRKEFLKPKYYDLWDRVTPPILFNYVKENVELFQ